MSGTVAFGGGKPARTKVNCLACYICSHRRIGASSAHTRIPIPQAVNQNLRLENVVMRFIRRLVKGYDDVTALYELNYGISMHTDAS